MRKIKLSHATLPWLEGEEVRAAMQARDQARTDKERTPCAETEREFRTHRNAVKLALNRACSQYFLASHKNQRSTTWKDIRRFIVSSKKPQPSPSHPADQDSRWANTLNDFFAAVGPGVADTLAQADSGETMQPRPPRVISGALSLRPATFPELSAALQGRYGEVTCVWHG